jgi:acyl-CoA thioesterase
MVHALTLESKREGGSMTKTFLQASTWERTSTGTWSTTIDAGWCQGRGAYGGLLGAGILRALLADVGDKRRVPRTMTIHFSAPAAPGPLTLETRLERKGAAVATWSARALQDGGVVTLVSATFAAPRSNPLSYNDARAPVLPPWRDVPQLDAGDVAPVFTRLLEYWPALGYPPYSGAPEARLGGYLRIPGAGKVDAPLAIALLDAWPPAAVTRLTDPRGAASVDMTVHFFEDLPLESAEADEPHLVVVTSRQAGGGYAEELCELFAPDGRLIAQARQLVALL